jgi:hypothetical protein
MMKTKIVVVFLLLLASKTFAQQKGELPKKQYVVSPSEHILLAIASQPDCPLLVEEAKLLLNVNKGKPAFLVQHRVRNKGDKAIVSYHLAAWSSNATGGTLGTGRFLESPLLPGNIYESRVEGDNVIPLTDEIRTSLKMDGNLKGILVLMVESIRFSDNSVYKSSDTSNALLKFFEERTEK